MAAQQDTGTVRQSAYFAGIEIPVSKTWDHSIPAERVRWLLDRGAEFDGYGEGAEILEIAGWVGAYMHPYVGLKAEEALGRGAKIEILMGQGILSNDDYLRGASIKGYVQHFLLDPNANKYLKAGDSFLLMKEWDAAISAYEKVLEDEPQNVHVLANLSYAFSEKGDYERGLDFAMRAKSADPYESSAWNNTGYILLQTGQAEKAIPELEEAIRLIALSQTNGRGIDKILIANTCNNLGDAYMKTGRFDDARSMYGGVLELDPSHAGTQDNLKKVDLVIAVLSGK